MAPADARLPSVSDRVAQYGQAVHRRLVPHFERAGVTYPPGAVVLVGIKSKKRLELYAGPTRDALRHVRTYSVMGVSGGPGPKLREGDRQVPEGIYAVTALNPASRFHLSMRIGYPNRFDRWMARKDGRRDLGGDIYIHGGYFSQGCLAMGDAAAEELFVLAAETGLENVTVILTPVDLRRRPQAPVSASAPEWTPWLYDVLERALRRLAPPAFKPASN
ncbi:MAG: L,D-transpeptidase family protein [Gammaproteobacteria bacterium]|nr:L,D-transpeptidase family protein [Gammaproteobacteria bacterium]NIR83174.1 L,D-transpeptidase family protein [Gammaproteobacteria bacterium]NIR90982.1 L,D-transpeptidase family protein [Gammaproteobacteria bacterium]NIU04339.1 L,D-transpeptidase family protein [Gammaproteobacteria bacterium]NIV52562.1 L,D-transpeptidase family protein [Gammaproteobacteria bacterium]